MVQLQFTSQSFELSLVVSMVKRPYYALAKFLDNMIKPYLPQTRVLKSTDHFIRGIKRMQSKQSKYYGKY